MLFALPPQRPPPPLARLSCGATARHVNVLAAADCDAASSCEGDNRQSSLLMHGDEYANPCDELQLFHIAAEASRIGSLPTPRSARAALLVRSGMPPACAALPEGAGEYASLCDVELENGCGDDPVAQASAMLGAISLRIGLLRSSSAAANRRVMPSGRGPLVVARGAHLTRRAWRPGIGSGRSPASLTNIAPANSLVTSCGSPGCDSLIHVQAMRAAAVAAGRIGGAIAPTDGCASRCCRKGARFAPARFAHRQLQRVLAVLGGRQHIVRRPICLGDAEAVVLAPAAAAACVSAAAAAAVAEGLRTHAWRRLGLREAVLASAFAGAHAVP